MKKILILLLPLLITSGCACRRQSDKHLSEAAVSSQITETTKRETSQSSGVTNTEKNEDVDIDIHITRYDTGKPVDPATGRPPVKEDENRTVKKRGNEKTNSKQKNQAESTEAGKQINNNQTNIVADETTDTSADVAGGKNFIWVWIAAIIVAAILVYLFTPHSFTKK